MGLWKVLALCFVLTPAHRIAIRSESSESNETKFEDMQKELDSYRARMQAMQEDLAKLANAHSTVGKGKRTLQELKDGGYTVQMLKNDGYSLKELKDVGYSAAELEHNGFTLEGMVGAGFSSEELLPVFGGFRVLEAGLKIPEAVLWETVLDNDLDSVLPALKSHPQASEPPIAQLIVQLSEILEVFTNRHSSSSVKVFGYSTQEPIRNLARRSPTGEPVTFLHFVADQSYGGPAKDAAVEFLLKMGAKVNVAHRGVRFSVYGTPLSQAARGKSVKMVQSLLNAKAAVDINCGGGKTPLFWAAKESRLHPNVSLDIIEVLLEAGADVTKKDQFGNTVLFQVIGNHYKKGSVEVAQKLLEAKADVNAMNNDGQTAVYAAALHDSDMRKFLEKEGGKCMGRETANFKPCTGFGKK